MVFCSTHTRLTSTSSDLRILSDILASPSPILKPDDLLISLTSGEIPIILDAAVHACDSTLFDFVGGTPGSGDVAEELKLADKYDAAGSTRGPTGGSEASLKERICEGLNDLYVAAGLPNSNGHRVEYPSNDSSPGVASPRLKEVTHCPVPYSLYDGEDDRHSNVSRNCPLAKSRGLGKFGGLRDSQASPSTMELRTVTVERKEDLDGDHPRMNATLPTPTFAPPSQSADVISPVSSPNSQPRHRRPLERARAVRFPGRPRSPRLPVNEIEANSAHNAPLSNRQMPHPRWQLTDSPTPASSTSSCPADSHVSDAEYPKHVALPEELSWLQNMTIELWIDQEGFRAVRPCMQLIGYSPRTRSLHPYEPAENAGIDVTAGVAEFMPTKRETFVFHYAALDSAPTLRMVSVAGDESRDYISKQATLSVKANGVYTVLGTETLITSVRNDAHGVRLQNVRLRWKFDYLVTDRKADATGKTLSGEKTLTPLTFSCSPYLLHPIQGKKAGLMHTMKKNLTPKLGSQKLEPPVCVTSHGVRVPETSHHPISTGSDTATTHIRSHSDVSVKGGHYSLTRSPLDNGIRGILTPGRSRRRRASSAGEHGLVYLRNEQGGMITSKEGPLFRL